MPKRKRTVPTKTKNANTRRFFPLLDLPPEVFDMILRMALQLSQFVEHSGFNDISTRDILKSNVMRTCTFLRQRAFQMIRDSLAWIRISCPKMEDWHALQSPSVRNQLVPQIFRPLLEPDLPTLDLFLGNKNLTAAGERMIQSPTRSIVLPFSHHLWLRYVDMFHTCYSFKLKSITIRYGHHCPNIDRVLHTYILPPLMGILIWETVCFTGSRFENFTDDRVRWITMPSAGEAEYESLKELHERLLEFDAKGQPGDADLLSIWSRVKLRSCVCGNKGGFRSLHNHNQSFGPQFFLVNNAIAQLCFLIELRSFRAFFNLYRREGSYYFRMNAGIPFDNGIRYIETLKLASFALRRKQRRDFHYMLGLVKDMVPRLQVDIELYDEDVSSILSSGFFDHHLIASTAYLKIAEQLSRPGDTEWELTPIQRKAVSSVKPADAGYVEYHNVQNTGYFWNGHKDVVGKLGGEYQLRYLPQLANSMLRTEEDEVIEYCGKKCNCIVF